MTNPHASMANEQDQNMQSTTSLSLLPIMVNEIITDNSLSNFVDPFPYDFVSIVGLQRSPFVFIWGHNENQCPALDIIFNKFENEFNVVSAELNRFKVKRTW